MTIRTSTLAGGGGAGFRLAPDLTFPADVTSNSGFKTLSLSGLTAGEYNTALSLTGKFSIGLINFSNLTPEQVDIRLTVDGVVIWNGGQVIPSNTFRLLGSLNSILPYRQYITCNSSLLLEIQTATGTACILTHDARPIL